MNQEEKIQRLESALTTIKNVLVSWDKEGKYSNLINHAEKALDYNQDWVASAQPIELKKQTAISLFNLYKQENDNDNVSFHLDPMEGYIHAIEHKLTIDFNTDDNKLYWEIEPVDEYADEHHFDGFFNTDSQDGRGGKNLGIDFHSNETQEEFQEIDSYDMLEEFIITNAYAFLIANKEIGLFLQVFTVSA